MDMNVPDYIVKLKQLKLMQQKKNKKKFLNLIVDIKGEDSLNNY